MDVHAAEMADLLGKGQQLAEAGHFDSAGILRDVQKFNKRCVFSINFDNLYFSEIIFSYLMYEGDTLQRWPKLLF